MLERSQSASAHETEDAHLDTVGRGKRVCIVSLGSISHNPRVVKEADALAGAGYDVVVVFLQHLAWAQELDRRILQRAKWRADIVDVSPSAGGRFRRLFSALQLRVFKWLCRWTLRFPVAELAWSRYFPLLLWRATRHRCDLYIGHYIGSLPVVAEAARRIGAKFAFDFEDFHRGEQVPGDAESLSAKLVVTLEDRYLPTASFITAASWGIADEVANTTRLAKPQIVLNAFPWADRATLAADINRAAGRPLSLYWFSQVVSFDRGLEDVIAAMALMRERADLHIRGNGVDGSIESLARLAKRAGVADHVRFHSTVPPDDLLGDAAGHDIGLCLELPGLPHRDVCLTNKIFIYMLAGLAVVATRTRDQTRMLTAAPEIGCLYDAGDVEALAAILDGYARDAALLNRCKMAALAAARDRWNWERESKTLIAAVDQALAPVRA